MTVAIVTDSGSDLTPAKLAEGHIRQVPLTVSFGEQSYLCPDELLPDAFWRKMTAATRGSTTRSPSRRTKLSGFPAKLTQGRIEMSRLNRWRSPTIGL